MTGLQTFLKMQEIDKHLDGEAEWWRGEGLDPACIALVLRTVADRISPSPSSWGEQWEAARPKSGRV